MNLRSDILWIEKEAKTSFCSVVYSLQNSKDCLSIILVTEDATERQIATLLRILKQMSNEIPTDLVRLSENHQGQGARQAEQTLFPLKGIWKMHVCQRFDQSLHKVTVVWH